MLLEFRNLTKTFGVSDGTDSISVLRGVNLQVAERETVAIVGPSGSGKSTLLNIAGGLDSAESGEVLVDGKDIGKLGDRDLAAYRNATVGFIFQLHHLLPQCTVLENVLVPTLAGSGKSRKELRERAESLVNAVGLGHRLHHRPGQLSGGERQRVSVARALINEPRILLADEPTGALDRHSAANLAELLGDLNTTHGVTLIVVTHALDLAARMQRVFELREGKLVEEKKPASHAPEIAR